MFHKKALKNTITCFVLLTLVFATLVVVAFAASETQSSAYVRVTITAYDNDFMGVYGSISGTYITGSHKHGTTDCPDFDDTYMGAGLSGVGVNGTVYDSHKTKKATSISLIDTYPDDFDLNYVLGEGGFECGDCYCTFSKTFKVYP